MTADPPTGPPPPPPGVRTTRRRGRTSAAKVAALADLGPTWSIPAAGPWDSASLAKAYGSNGPLLIDIGPGNGAATLAWGRQRPDARVLAIELHRPGIAALLLELDAEGPANVRVAEADAVAVLDELEPATVDTIRVLFPDPWPKRRHVARRMVDRAFVAASARVLIPGGHLHLATDWPDYAEHMRTMVATDARFEAAEPVAGAERPVTTYEQRGQRAGRPIADLWYQLRATPHP